MIIISFENFVYTFKSASQKTDHKYFLKKNEN